MADSSLDDFFAKKDKSKKKSKQKFSVTDILDNPTEEPKKIIKKKKKKEENSGDRPAGDTSVTQNAKNRTDEEWKEEHDEYEADYTGLRIKNLTIEGEKESEEDKEKCDDDEEGADKADNSSGVWKVQSAPVPVPAPVEEPPPEPKPDTAPKTIGKYVPPSQRNNAAAKATTLVTPGRKGKKHAPKLDSELDFPTLGGAAQDLQHRYDDPSSGARFEQVRSGGRQMEDPSKTTTHVEIENRFQSLQTGTE